MNKVYKSYPTQASHREAWIELIQRWQESGLPARLFCEQEKINLADLRRWHYRLRKRQQEDALSTPIVSNKQAMKFIPLQVQTSLPSLSSAPKNHFDLFFGANYRLLFYEGFDEGLLTKLLVTLQRVMPC